MNARNTTTRGVLALFTLASCASTVGSYGDGAIDREAVIDAALDATGHTPRDGAIDGALDAPGDTAQDAALDASIDARGDAAVDTAIDATSDAAIDATSDAAVDAAPRDVRAADCDLATSYDFGWHGGLVIFEWEGRLAPGRRFTLTRVYMPSSFRDAGVAMCSTTLDRCGEAEASVAELSFVLDALDDPDVTAAFAQPPGVFYGSDPTVHDTNFFEITRADGRGFRVGDRCDGAPMCREVPAGLARLSRALNGLLWNQGRRPECGGIGPG